MEDLKNCPHCENIGWYVDANHYTGEPEQVQCKFCYTEPKSFFNHIQSLQSQLDTLKEENEKWQNDYLEQSKLLQHFKIENDILQDEWISVEEKPIPRPKEGIEVLLWDGDSCDHFKAFPDWLINLNSANQNEWEVIDKHITHWKPIKPPKGEADG